MLKNDLKKVRGTVIMWSFVFWLTTILIISTILIILGVRFVSK